MPVVRRNFQVRGSAPGARLGSMSRNTNTHMEDREALIYKDDRWIGEATHLTNTGAPKDNVRF